MPPTRWRCYGIFILFFIFIFFLTKALSRISASSAFALLSYFFLIFFFPLTKALFRMCLQRDGDAMVLHLSASASACVCTCVSVCVCVCVCERVYWRDGGELLDALAVA